MSSADRERLITHQNQSQTQSQFTPSVLSDRQKDKGAMKKAEDVRTFSRAKANSTFWMVLLINLVVNIDHGVLPGGLNIIPDAIGITESQYGFLESAVFFGNILGSVSATVVYRKVPTKFVLMGALTLNALMQLLFVLIDNFYALLVIRIFSGSFQVFVTIYWPVWVDAFAENEGQKGFWMTMILIFSIGAYVIGYGLVLGADAGGSWTISFYTMIGLAVPFVLWIAVIPDQYLDPLLAPEKDPNGDAIEVNEEEAALIVSKNSKSKIASRDAQKSQSGTYDTPQTQRTLISGTSANESFAEDQESNRDSFAIPKKPLPRKDSHLTIPRTRKLTTYSAQSGQISVRSLIRSEKSVPFLGSVASKLPVPLTTEQVVPKESLESETYCTRLGAIMSNPGYVLIMLSLAMFWFMVCGAQTWLTSFLEEAVGAPSSSAAIFVMVSSLTTPILGAVVGNVIFAQIGGYQSPKALPLCIMITLCTSLLSIPIPWMDNVPIVYTLMWLAQFVAIMFTPAAMAIMLMQVEPERRTTASSIANLAFNCIGYLPAPLIYTQVVKSFGTDLKTGNQVAMAVTLYVNGISFLLLSLAFCCRRKPDETEDEDETLGDPNAADPSMRDTELSQSRYSMPGTLMSSQRENVPFKEGQKPRERILTQQDRTSKQNLATRDANAGLTIVQEEVDFERDRSESMPGPHTPSIVEQEKNKFYVPENSGEE